MKHYRATVNRKTSFQFFSWNQIIPTKNSTYIFDPYLNHFMLSIQKQFKKQELGCSRCPTTEPKKSQYICKKFEFSLCSTQDTPILQVFLSLSTKSFLYFSCSIYNTSYYLPSIKSIE